MRAAVKTVGQTPRRNCAKEDGKGNVVDTQNPGFDDSYTRSVYGVIEDYEGYDDHETCDSERSAANGGGGASPHLPRAPSPRPMRVS